MTLLSSGSKDQTNRSFIPFKRSIAILILILFVGNLFFGYKYASSRKNIANLQNISGTNQVNERILNFSQLFIEKVLKAENEIDFETRLQLETTVRNLNDQEILNQWQSFVSSRNEIEAQENVKNLLEILIKKIRA